MQSERESLRHGTRKAPAPRRSLRSALGALAAAGGILLIAPSASAVYARYAPGVIGIPKTPNDQAMIVRDSWTLKNADTAAAGVHRVIIPLVSQSDTLSPPTDTTYEWVAVMKVSATTSCTLYVGDDTVDPATPCATATGTESGGYVLLTATSACSKAYVECRLPPNGGRLYTVAWSY